MEIAPNENPKERVERGELRSKQTDGAWVTTLLLVLIVLGAACSPRSEGAKSASSSPGGKAEGGVAAWADEMCGAMRTHVDDMMVTMGRLEDELEVATSSEAVKSAYEKYLTGLVDTGEKTNQALADAGAPPVENGEQIANDYAAPLANWRGGLDPLLALVRGEQDFSEQLSDRGGDHYGIFEVTGTRLAMIVVNFVEVSERQDDPALSAALDGNENCDAVVNALGEDLTG